MKKTIKVGILIGYGEYCDCKKMGYDCVVLYGGKCPRNIKPSKKK